MSLGLRANEQYAQSDRQLSDTYFYPVSKSFSVISALLKAGYTEV